MGEKDPSVKMDIAALGHMFYVMKFLDWTDTFIFLAKKKVLNESNTQVTVHFKNCF